MTSSPKNPRPRGGTQIGRRDALLAGLGAGLGAGLAVVAPHATLARGARVSDSRGIIPAGGAIAQTATLQQALDDAAASGKPLFLPAGTYKTGTLT